MKLGKLLLMGMLSGFVFTACVDNDDKSEWNDGSQPVSFTSSIKGVKTRAADTKWTAGDKVGIFMKAVGGELSAATGVNKSHTADANGNLTASDADNALYYPTDGSAVDFIAYYPYTASLTGNTYKVDVTTQTDQPAIDLLYSDNAKNFAKGGASKPQLQFTHMLSQIVFNIEKDATIPSLNGLKVTFKGMNTKADFALADGTLSNAGTPANIVAVIEEATAKTIVLPAASLSNIQVVFELNNKTYTADYPQNTLEAGRKYTHKVKLSDSNGQPVIEMEPAAITDWIEVPGGDINVDFGEGGVTPPIEGIEVSIDNPYNETFADGQGGFTINNVVEPASGKSVWAFDSSYKYMFASGRVGTTDYNSEGWLISPVLQLANAKIATLMFDHAFKFGNKADLTLQIKEIGQSEWTAITIPNYPTGNDWNFISSGDIDLSAYVNKSIQFAFKYTSTPSSSAKWEIKNIKLTLKDSDNPEPVPTGNLVKNPGFEEWGAILPTSWDNAYNTGTIVKSEDIKHAGNNALRQTSGTDAVKIQQEIAIVGGKTYRISYWYLDNDTKASTRMWTFWLNGSTTMTDNQSEFRPNTYSTDAPEWQQITHTLKAPAAATKLRLEVRTYRNTTSKESGGYCYYDDFEVIEVAE